MTAESNPISRRKFIKSAGIAGMGTAFASIAASADGARPVAPHKAMPTRPFGKTGVDVPILSLGGMVDFESNQLLLRQAIQNGVTYWDTAALYQSTSEGGIGKYFAKYPEDRKKIFIATKSTLTDTNGWEYQLDRSLEKMKTTYVDLFLIHEVESIQRLAPFDKTRNWVAKKKAQGKFRFFGVSAHQNMEAVMLDGASLGWLDGMMVSYNYRNQFSERMKRAVAACREAGIGITAMKTQAPAVLGGSTPETRTALALAEAFLKKGFSPEQARLKAVWESPDIASICSQMNTMAILHANVAAAMDPTGLSSNETALFKRYAAETQSHYCAGCSRICQSAMHEAVPIADIMRYLMYSKGYGDHAHAQSLYRQIPKSIRSQLCRADYAEAERRCPHRLAIGDLVLGAIETLA